MVRSAVRVRYAGMRDETAMPRLAAAVILSAVTEGDWRWLRSTPGELYAEMVGLDLQCWRDWLERTAPGPRITIGRGGWLRRGQPAIRRVIGA